MKVVVKLACPQCKNEVEIVVMDDLAALVSAWCNDRGRHTVRKMTPVEERKN